MNQPQSPAEVARPSRKTRYRAACWAGDADPEGEPSVVLSWAGSGAECEELRHIELAAPSGAAALADAKSVWTSRTPVDVDWIETLLASNCAEVLLTARVGESGLAKQLVLELAGLLIRRLNRTKPTIHVRFVPRTEAATSERRRG